MSAAESQVPTHQNNPCWAKAEEVPLAMREWPDGAAEGAGRSHQTWVPMNGQPSWSSSVAWAGANGSQTRQPGRGRAAACPTTPRYRLRSRCTQNRARFGLLLRLPAASAVFYMHASQFRSPWSSSPPFSLGPLPLSRVAELRAPRLQASPLTRPSRQASSLSRAAGCRARVRWARSAGCRPLRWPRHRPLGAGPPPVLPRSPASSRRVASRTLRGGRGTQEVRCRMEVEGLHRFFCEVGRSARPGGRLGSVPVSSRRCS